MDKKTIFIKTSKGESEVSSMSGDMKRVLLLIDGTSNLNNVIKRAPPSLRGDLSEIIQRLLDAELINDKAKVNAAVNIVSPKIVAPKKEQAGEELDFTQVSAAPGAAELAAGAGKEKVRADLQEADKRKEDAAAKARQQAEIAAKAKAEAEARLRAGQEAARVKAELEVAAKVRRQMEENAKREAEAARIKAEQEAARIKAEFEAAARAKAKAEAALRKAEAEAARVKAELEAARARAEAEARALAEERARIEAEERKRREEAEAARIKAEEEAAARARAEEERQRQEAEAARIRAEEEAAARARAEEERKRQEAAARPSTNSSFKIDLAALKEVASAPVMVQQDGPAHAAEPVQQISAEKQKDKTRQPDIAAEMARLKAEQDAEQLRVQREALNQEEAQRLAAEQGAAWAEAEQRAAQQSKLEAEQAALQAALAQAKAQQKAPGPRQRRPLPLGKIVGGLAGLALVLIFVLPLLWPMDEYISPVEQHLSARLGQPVKIGGLNVSLLPLPKMEIRQITVGPNQQLAVAGAVLRFDPLSLFSPNKVIDETELQGVVVEGKGLEQVMGWLNGLNGDTLFSLRQMPVHDLQIKMTGIALPQLKGSALFEGGEFSRLVLHDEADKLHVDLKSVSGRLQIAFGIRESTLPLLPQILFSDFNAKGEIMEGGMVLSELDAHAYNGIWSGSGKLSWRNEWRLEARINAKTMELDKMFPQYGVNGEVFADGIFSSHSASLSGLADAMRLEATFEAKRGVINGIDMVETARLLSREHLVGGRTHFDQLNGSVLLENHVLRLRRVKISSGMLNASGSLDISGEGYLSGNFDSEIKMRAGNNSLVLSGTLKEPRLQAR
ncbi:MAG: hypothetical protein Q8O64_05390 [Sideroxyarcus sp.]|nr:hypothetical protein [Sideroxyarcus sp.]